MARRNAKGGAEKPAPPTADEHAQFFRDKAAVEESFKVLGQALAVAALWVLPRSEFAREEIAKQLVHGWPELVMNEFELQARDAEVATLRIKERLKEAAALSAGRGPAELVVMLGGRTAGRR